MTGLSFFNKSVVFLNAVATLFLLGSCITPYVSLAQLPLLPYLSLVVPIVIVVNLLFLVYWLFVKKRLMLISFIPLVIAFIFHGTFYEVRFTERPVQENELRVMSFNARGFDPLGHLKKEHIDREIIGFVAEQDPDIVCFQEFDHKQTEKFVQYPYKFFNYRTKNGIHVPQAIFSKYPILKKGSLDFPGTPNNAVYADILYKTDTLRVYNVHLQSYGFVPKRGHLRELATGGFYQRLNRTFHLQQKQAETVAAHMASTPYAKILCGDLNNTQFSKVYRIIKGDMDDSFRAMAAPLTSNITRCGLTLFLWMIILRSARITIIMWSCLTTIP